MQSVRMSSLQQKRKSRAVRASEDKRLTRIDSVSDGKISLDPLKVGVVTSGRTMCWLACLSNASTSREMDETLTDGEHRNIWGTIMPIIGAVFEKGYQGNFFLAGFLIHIHLLETSVPGEPFIPVLYHQCTVLLHHT